MARIFISYKRKDKKKVLEITEKVEVGTGIKCWIDLDGIPHDATIFPQKIVDAIDACEIVLFMYSKEHQKITDFNNDWTLRELNYAKQTNKRVVFINIDGSKLQGVFLLNYGLQQQVDALSDKNIERLIRDLKIWLNLGPVPEPDAIKPDIKSSFLNKQRIIQLQKIFNYAVILIPLITFVYFCASDNKSPILHAITLILYFISQISIIGVLFNKKVFGWKNRWKGAGFYLLAAIISFASWGVSIVDDFDSEETETIEQTNVDSDSIEQTNVESNSIEVSGTKDRPTAIVIGNGNAVKIQN